MARSLTLLRVYPILHVGHHPRKVLVAPLHQSRPKGTKNEYVE